MTLTLDLKLSHWTVYSSQLGNLSHRSCLYWVTRVTQTLCRGDTRGYKHYTGWYEYYTSITQGGWALYKYYVMSA